MILQHFILYHACQCKIHANIVVATTKILRFLNICDDTMTAISHWAVTCASQFRHPCVSDYYQVNFRCIGGSQVSPGLNSISMGRYIFTLGWWEQYYCKPVAILLRPHYVSISMTKRQMNGNVYHPIYLGKCMTWYIFNAQLVSSNANTSKWYILRHKPAMPCW